MSMSPMSADCQSLNDSWVDVDSVRNVQVAPPLHHLVRNNAPTLQSLERLLFDAQKESTQSSLKGSLLHSGPITPDDVQTPQTPPNSFFNNNMMLERSNSNTDWLWDWSGQDQLYKNWDECSSSRKSRLSLRQWIIRRGILSKEVLSLLFLTNILSLLIGAGVGYTIILRKTL